MMCRLYQKKNLIASQLLRLHPVIVDYFLTKACPHFFLLIMYKLMSFYLLKEWELIHKHCTFIIRLNMHR